MNVLAYEDLNPGLISVCWDGDHLDLGLIYVFGIWTILATKYILEFFHLCLEMGKKLDSNVAGG